jgi:hypothetical protein
MTSQRRRGEEVDDAGKVLNVYSTTQLSLLIEGTESEVKKTYRQRASGVNIFDRLFF